MPVAGGIRVGHDPLIRGAAELQASIAQCDRCAVFHSRQRLDRGNMNRNGTGNAGTARTVASLGVHRGNHLTVIAAGSRFYGQALGIDGCSAYIGTVGQLGHTNTNRSTQGNTLGGRCLIGNAGNKFCTDDRPGTLANGCGQNAGIGSIRILSCQNIHSGDNGTHCGGKTQLRAAGTNLVAVSICPQGKGDGFTRVGLAAEKGSRAVGDIANRDIDRLLGDNRRHMEGERIAFKGHTIGIVEHIAGISHGDGNGEAPGTVRTLHCCNIILVAVFALLGGDGDAADLLARLYRGIVQADGDSFPGGSLVSGQLNLRGIIGGNIVQLCRKVNDQRDVLCGHYEAPLIIGINLDIHSGGNSLRAGAGGIGVVHTAHCSAIGGRGSHNDLIAGVGLPGRGILTGSGIGNGA